MHYDVIVIGMGAMGAATLHQLARRGVRVAGLDRYAPPHDRGSSHGDTRITRQATGEGAAYVPLALNSQRIWRELEALSGEALFEACGMLMLGDGRMPSRAPGTADYAGDTAALASAFGIEHSLLDAEGLRERFPHFAGFGERAVGYYEPGAGDVRPERAIAVQLRLARQSGAALHPDTAVSAIEPHPRGVRVHAGDGSLTAGRVIVAAGMWAGPLLGAPFDRLLRVCRQRLFWFELDEPERFAPGSPVFILLHGAADTESCYGFPPLPGENAVKIATEHYSDAGDPDAIDRAVGQAEIDAFYETHVAGRLLGLSRRAVKTRVCTYTVTPDFGFVVDAHPGLAGVTVVSACSGHGFKHSAGIGEALAMRHCGEAGAADLSAFSLARLLPLHETA